MLRSFDLKALAARHDVWLPSEPSQTKQWQLKVLTMFSGAEFDKQHRTVRHEAAKDIPTLKKRLDMSQMIVNSVRSSDLEPQARLAS